MAYVSTFSLEGQESSAFGFGLLREPHRPVAEPAVGGQGLCRRDGCPADFAASGGVATGNEVADYLRVRVCQPVSLLARWIVDRRVIVFSCGADLLLPLFQFDFAQGCLRSGVAPVLSELTGVMSDQEIACWFSQPNGWLNGAVPARIVLTEVAAALTAARADRFLVAG